MWYIIEYSEMPLKLLLGFKMVIMAKRRFWRVGVTLKGSASYFKDSTRGEGEGGGWYTMEGFHRPPSFPLKRLLSVQMYISQIFSLAILWQQLAFYFEAFENLRNQSGCQPGHHRVSSWAPSILEGYTCDGDIPVFVCYPRFLVTYFLSGCEEKGCCGKADRSWVFWAGAIESRVKPQVESGSSEAQ